MERGVDPSSAGDVLKQLLDVWDDASERMLTTVARRLAQGVDRDGWAEVKARQTLSIRDELRAILARLGIITPGLAEQALAEAYAIGQKVGAARDLPIAIGSRPGVVQRLVERLVAQLFGTHVPVLREHVDLFQLATTQTEALVQTGTITRREAVALVVDRLLVAGEDRFVDRSGRRWHLDTYARMAGRTIAGQSAVQGQLDEMAAEGEDLVIVSDSPRECTLCRPWERELLSITGESVGLVIEGRTVRFTVAEAVAGGLWHPNCTHRPDPVIIGLTDINRPPQRNPEGYRDQQHLRSLERRARELKRRAAAADQFGDTKTARDLRAKIRANSIIIDEHTDVTGQLRKRDREQLVTRPRRPVPPRNVPNVAPRPAGEDNAPAIEVSQALIRERARQHAEDRLPPLRKATAEDLDTRLTRATEAEDYDRLDAIVAEMERREQLAAQRAERAAQLDEQRWERLAELVAQGTSEEDAIAEVFGRSVKRQRRDRAIASLREDGYRGAGFDELARKAYRDEVYRRYIAAEDATNGQLLTPSARSAGVDPLALFTGPEARARLHASDELKEWWDHHGRLTFEQYKAALLGEPGSDRFRSGGEDWLQ